MTDAPQEDRLVRLSRLTEHPALGVVASVAVVSVGLIVLHHLAREISWVDLRTQLHGASRLSLGLALAFTALSYAALSLYDVIALRAAVPGRVGPWVAAATGASGFAFSNLLGFSYLTGTAVRFRVYNGMGLDGATVALILATAWTAFWMGLTLVFGLLMVFHPTGLGAELAIPPGVETAIGLALLCALAAVFALLARRAPAVDVLGMRIALPTPEIALMLTGAASADLVFSALVLFVLLPPDAAHGFPYFFAIYVGAIALGVLSHAPGGIGVFEATVIAGLGAAGRPDVLAALLLYRAIYYLLPFAVAATGLALAWSLRRRASLEGTAARTARTIEPLVPLAAAGLALAAGLVLLVSGSLPADTDRIVILRAALPLPVVELSHLAGSAAGVLLMVLARGLYRRLYRAWLLALILLGIGGLASLAKGLDWEEALALLAAAVLLVSFRGAFYRVRGGSILRLSPGWVLSLAALVAAITWLGVFAFAHVEYRDALWWRFAWSGDASRFMRASVVAAVLLGAVALNSVLSARGRAHKPEPIPDTVRRLLQACPDSEANLALLGDKSFLLDPDGHAFLAYADTGRALVTKGDPVGEPAAARELLWQLREMADREGKRCVFYAVSAGHVPTYLDMGLTILKFGEVARVDLSRFTLDGPKMKDFRHARNRAAREGYVFEIVPAADVAAILPDLRRVSDAWLARKAGQEKGFALGFFDEAYLENFDHAVLRQGETGRIVAFANLMKGATVELSVDLMRYDPEGPSFAMDALFGELLLWGAGQAFAWFNLGAAPFSGVETRKLASVWQRLGGFVYTHGDKVYHFEGLRTFKEKFDPIWSPNYLATSGGLALPQALFEVNRLISGGVVGLVHHRARD